jgi:hypothetical protein
MPSSARLLLLFAVLSGLCASALAHVPTVVAARSKIIGTTTMVPSATAVVNQFLGVRFAQPVKRLQPPLPVIPREQVVDATVRGASCIQQFNRKLLQRDCVWEIDVDHESSADSDPGIHRDRFR